MRVSKSDVWLTKMDKLTDETIDELFFKIEDGKNSLIVVKYLKTIVSLESSCSSVRKSQCKVKIGDKSHIL